MPVARMLGPVTILSDADIRRYLAKGEVQIAPYDEAHLTPNGYDVTIEEVLIPASNVRTTTGVAKIPPTTRFAVSTRESVRLGRHLAGQIWLRTTWARRGVIASFGMIDAGFSGTLTFGAWNGSSDPLELPIGDRFAQIVFLTLESPSSETYEKRSGTYQGQRGVTLDRPSRRTRRGVASANTRGPCGAEDPESPYRPAQPCLGCGLLRLARPPAPGCDTRGPPPEPRLPRTRSGGSRTPCAGGRG